MLRRLRNMGGECAFLLKGGLMVSCALLLCSAVILIVAGDWSLRTYYLHSCARYMRDLAPAILFIAVFGSAWWEERRLKSRNR